MTEVQGTKEHPWLLKTPSGTSAFTMYQDETHNPPQLVCTVGKTVLQYDLRCINDLQAMRMAIGWSLGVPMNRSQQEKEQWKHGTLIC